MKPKRQWKKVFVGLLALFFFMFTARFIYGYFSYPNGSLIQSAGLFDGFSSRSLGYANIASEKYSRSKGGESAPGEIVSVDQKYEKTANLGCTTNDFEKDEKAIRKTIEEENAIIQFQQQLGTNQNRKLFLQIGVQPDRFDLFLDKIKQIGSIVSLDVSKKDKTNEYRELNSKIQTLQNTRRSLIELKSKGGKIEEYINLENRILDIDGQLQALGVQMGSFDTENEFCTVNISLKEGKVVQKISFIQRVKVAGEWTIQYYLMLMAFF